MNIYHDCENKDIKELANCTRVKQTAQLYAKALARKAKEIFDKYGSDFDFNVKNDSYTYSSPNYSSCIINFEIPGLGKAEYNYTPDNFSYSLERALDQILGESSYSYAFWDINNDNNPSDMVKELNEAKEQIQNEYRQKIKKIIELNAEKVVKNDPYSKLG